MSPDDVISRVRSLMTAAEARVIRAQRLAQHLRDVRGYRWVGVYDVGDELVSIIAWSGPGAPAPPTFHVTKGLTGAAVRAKATLLVNDVANDPRYLTAFGTTGSEIIVPVSDPVTGRVVGTLDVESDRTNAFSDADRRFLEQCAQAATPLWGPGQ